MSSNNESSIIVAITGASGAIYGIKILELLAQHNIITHLIVSKAAALTIALETEYSINNIIQLSTYHHKYLDIAAPIASGSVKTSGMIVAPCSAKTLASIAQGYEDNLIARAASVTLKERRSLVLMLRESPYHLTHLENMIRVTKMGGIIAPPVPAFYNKPSNICDIVSYSAGRVLDLLGYNMSIKRWK